MAAFQVPPPERFNFSRPEEWPKLAGRFERYRYASGVSDKEESIQVHTLHDLLYGRRGRRHFKFFLAVGR